MKLSLSQLSLLIELTEVELAEMKKIIDNPSSSIEAADDAGEHSMQIMCFSSIFIMFLFASNMRLNNSTYT